MFRLKKKKPGFFAQLVEKNEILPIHDRKKGLAFLIALFDEIRPSNGNSTTADKNLEQVIGQMRTQVVVLANTQHALLSQLLYTDITSALTESGIPMSRGFWQELFNRFKHKLLPPLQDENDFLYVINHVFYKKNDYQWVEGIPRKRWIEFFQLVTFNFNPREENFRNELVQAQKILSFQVAQLGLEKAVLSYLPPDAPQNDTPFVLQNYRVHELEKLLLINAPAEELNLVSASLKKVIRDCYQLIDHIRESHSEKGASIHQTYILLILSNRLERMELITDVLDSDHSFDTGRFVHIFRLLVHNEKRKNSIREFLSQGVGYLAYQIAEHKGSKGNKYITETRRDYNRMILGAMAGGFFISFTAVLKNMIGKLKLAPFPLGFLYGLNYSIGFVLIDETGSTLATKQPAFTASAVASSLDTKKIEGEPDLEGLAAMVAKVSRSQIASFFGNLVLVFPLTYFLAWAYHEVMGEKLVSGAAAANLLLEQHPWRSASLLYACFTGFFLFVSGIIAGYWQNKIRYGQIKERLKKHPILKVSLSPRRLEKLANYVEKHLGALVGSISLGFFLGFSGVVGKIFGIPFDIRHITIASGNVAIAVYGLGVSTIPAYFLLAVVVGVLAIGFFNFMVSFSLAFFMAVRSRGIRLSQYPRLLKVLGTYFVRHPREFVLPPRKQPDPVYKPLKGEE